MKYAIYGALGVAACVYLMGPKKIAQGVWDGTGGAVINGAGQLVTDLAKTQVTQADLEFLATVKGLYGISPVSDKERNLILSFRPTGSMLFDSFSFIGFGLIPAYYAKEAADAIHQYRTFNQWGITQ